MWLDVTSLHCVFQMSPQMLMRISAHGLEAFVLAIHTAWPGLSICHNDEWCDAVMVTLLHLSLTSNNICLNSPVNVMVTMIHLLSTANNICLNSPMQATNPSTPIKHFNTMLPAGKYEKRGTYFQTSKIACKGLYYKLMEILTNFEFPRQIIKFYWVKVLHPLPHSK